MTRVTSGSRNVTDPHALIDQYIDSIKEDLWALNKQIHDHPETALQEHKAHDAVAGFVETHGHSRVTRHAYGLDTALEARSAGGGGPLVNFNAEYDALPDLGHACGHNLICVAAVAAYLALARVLEVAGWGGRVQLLGTPAEESRGGKILLLDAGAYAGVDVSLMAHPSSEHAWSSEPYVGVAGQPTLANAGIYAVFTGRSAHAGANPWDGINALDAVVASYNNISMLRQQIKPDQRIHGAIQETPRITNAIPEHTKLRYTVRSTTVADLQPLQARVEKCIEAGALATGCTLDMSSAGNSYANLKVNGPLAEAYASYIDSWGVKLKPLDPNPVAASTDMGNVSHVLPGLHATVGIPTHDETAFPHNRAFVAASGTREAFERFVIVAKALAATGLRVCVDESFLRTVKEDFHARSELGKLRL